MREMANFEAKGQELFINGKRVLKAWESFSGWYWFAVAEAWKQNSVIDGKVYKNDRIYFGLIQGIEEEWGYFSQAEIESLSPMTWRIERQDLPIAGRREKKI